MKKHKIMFIFILIFAATALLLLSSCRKTTENTDSSAPHESETESFMLETSNQTVENTNNSDNQELSEKDDLYELRQEQAKGEYYFERQKENDRKAIEVLSKFYNKDFPLLIKDGNWEFNAEEKRIVEHMLTAVSSGKLDYYTEAKPMILYMARREFDINRLREEDSAFSKKYKKFEKVALPFVESDSSLGHDIEIAMDPMFFGEWPPVESKN